MDNAPAPAPNEGTAHNDASNAKRQPSPMQVHAKDAAKRLSNSIRDLMEWHGSMIDLSHRPPSEATTADLMRLNRLAGIVLAQVESAQQHTNEAMWISRREFPEEESAVPQRAEQSGSTE